jgi:hypothetical protein
MCELIILLMVKFIDKKIRKNASKVILYGIYGHFFLHPDCKNAYRSQFSDEHGYDTNNFKWTRELKTAQK